MKPFLLISLCSATLLNAQIRSPRDSSSDVEQRLLNARKQMLQQASQAKLEPAKGSSSAEIKTPPPPPPGIFASSDILCFNGVATLVPKSAILHQPKEVASRVNSFQAGSKLLNWLDFYTQNRGWITTVEVSRAQAQGKKALDEKTAEQFRKGTNLVVATYQGGPVSVNPLKEPGTGIESNSTSPKSKP